MAYINYDSSARGRRDDANLVGEPIGVGTPDQNAEVLDGVPCGFRARGGEDREFGERLMHAGIRPRQIRHRAICVHLWHDRDYVHAEGLQYNREIRRHTAARRSRFTDHGIVKTDPPR